MHDFGKRDLAGMRAVLKPRNFWKKPSTVKERTLTVVSGSGCNPDPAWGRQIVVSLGKGHSEKISSYDLEYVIDGTKKIYHTESEPVDVDICEEK